MIYQLTIDKMFFWSHLAGWEFVIRDINDCRKTPWLEFWQISSDQGIAPFGYRWKMHPLFGRMFFKPMDFILEAPEKKHWQQQIYTIPYQVFLIKTPFVGSAVLVFLGKQTAFWKERAVVHDIARKHGFDSSEAEGLDSGFSRVSRWFAVYVIYHKNGCWMAKLPQYPRFGGIQQWYVLNDFTVDSVLVYMVVGYVIMTLVHVMLRDAVGYARSVENNYPSQTRSTSWYKLTWRASELVQV